MSRKLLLEFHPITERPEYSCQVVYIGKYGGLSTTYYSQLHDSFNSFDEIEETEEHKQEWDEYVLAWAYSSNASVKKRTRGILNEIYG